MISETQKKGLETELHCMQDLTNLGIESLTPNSGACRYDIVADVDGKLIRIQCKYSNWGKHDNGKHETFSFPTYRTRINMKVALNKRYTSNEIDYFYTWLNGQGYLIHVDEPTGRTFTLRYKYPDNGQKKNVHIASDYEIEKVISQLIRE